MILDLNGVIGECRILHAVCSCRPRQDILNTANVCTGRRSSLEDLRITWMLR
ncbi:hypothetical protein Hypma_008930 [Hypsizygus marmoreus]|uniref:Uncharacterized protein n=1 Tax=Hypsizygus marmoreus TaxID=39966 RepID=A0A369JQ16_HYPMA|nr:hypothetical protein Hypma_008930 [Hypsizygus marmoreus]